MSVFLSLLSEKKINIAIDGPAGAGKSTVARLVAKQLKYVYIDTGAMYRAVTYYALMHGIDHTHEREIEEALSHIQLAFDPTEQGQQVYLNGENISENIRSREVTSKVSLYAQIASVRHYLGELQKELAINKGIVMDGRDIGTYVLPDAELKIFLTASVKVRALRRFNELTEQNYIPLAQLEAEIQSRDELDQNREISPLIQAHDAILLDSSELTIDEVVDQIVNLSRTKM